MGILHSSYWTSSDQTKSNETEDIIWPPFPLVDLNDLHSRGAPRSSVNSDAHYLKTTAQFFPSVPDVNICYGFLPQEPPVCRLEHPWSEWEEALSAAKGLSPGHGEMVDKAATRWRKMIREELKLIEVEALFQDVPRLRRAHSVLAFLMHFYVHTDTFTDQNSSGDQPAKVPSSIAIPLCAASDVLEMPPVLTYSDTVLYNWKLIDPKGKITSSNIEINTTFTDTESEIHFFKTSFMVELLGPSCLLLMKECLEEAKVADEKNQSQEWHQR